MKILFVIGSLEIGGAEKQMVLLIEGLSKKGFECEVFSLEGYGPLKERLDNINVVVYDGGYRSGAGKIWFIKQLLKSLYRLIRVLLGNKYQVVHAYLPLANFFAAVAGSLCRVKLLITSRRALGTHQERYPVWRYFDYISNKLSHNITVNSMGVWNDVISRENVPEGKLTLIYNGIDIAPFKHATKTRNLIRNELNYSTDDLVIVMIANLIAYKGHHDVIRALSLITEKKLKMVFVGEDRGIKASLEKEIEALAVETEINFLGRRDDIPAILAASDIGLVASHEEGFCNALLEIMATGLPVIATDVGGNPEALKQGELGVLVPAKSPVAISDAIMLLVDNKPLRVSYGKKALNEVASCYSVNNMVKKHINLYESS